jgi:DNA polymerase I-like protein with 3'-5' exonuclease and polymerase domains
VVAKQWLVESTKALNEANIDAKLIAFVHDETQWEVDVSQAQQAMKIIEEAATKAGEVLQFRCPVDAEGKIGSNWKQTH